MFIVVSVSFYSIAIRWIASGTGQSRFPVAIAMDGKLTSAS